MSTVNVYLLDQNINDFVVDVPKMTLGGGEYGQLLVNPLPQITGNNVRRFWSQQNQASPFYGSTSLFGFPIRIEQDGVVIFDGHVLNIDVDDSSRTAQVQLRSQFQKVMESGCVYVSLDDEFPSQAAQKILTQYGIPIDAGSFGAATAVYSTDLVYINIQQPLGDTTVATVLQAICELGVARIALSNGVLRFDVWTENLDTNPLYTFTDEVPNNPDGCTLMVPAPADQSIQKDLIQGYTVEWVGGTEDFGGEFDNKKTISGPADGVVSISSSQAAVWIGRQWLTYMQRPQRRITINVPTRIAKSLDVAYPIGVLYSRWGESLTIDITSINAGNMVVTTIVGTTR
jgi:hypothetical protein